MASYIHPELVSRAQSHAREMLQGAGAPPGMSPAGDVSNPFSSPGAALPPAPPGGPAPTGPPGLPQRGGPPGPPPSGPPAAPPKPAESISMNQLSSVPDYVARFLVDVGRKALGIPEGGGGGEAGGGGMPPMPGGPSHGYTVAEDGKPETVTAPGYYFPTAPGEVIPNEANGGPPMEPRQFGGPTTPWQIPTFAAERKALAGGRWNIPSAPQEHPNYPPPGGHSWGYATSPSASYFSTPREPGSEEAMALTATHNRMMPGFEGSMWSPWAGARRKSSAFMEPRMDGGSVTPSFPNGGGGRSIPMFPAQFGEEDVKPSWIDPHGNLKRMFSWPGKALNEAQTTGFASSRKSLPPAPMEPSPQGSPGASGSAEVAPATSSSQTTLPIPGGEGLPAGPSRGADIGGNFFSEMQRFKNQSPRDTFDSRVSGASRQAGLIPTRELPAGGHQVQVIRRAGGTGPGDVYSQWFAPDNAPEDIRRMSEAGGPWGGGMLMTPQGAVSGAYRVPKEVDEAINHYMTQAAEYEKAGMTHETNMMHFLATVEAAKYRFMDHAQRTGDRSSHDAALYLENGSKVQAQYEADPLRAGKFDWYAYIKNGKDAGILPSNYPLPPQPEVMPFEAFAAEAAPILEKKYGTKPSQEMLRAKYELWKQGQRR